ncbi:unnamed protein product [Umbelopsis vinacea]
MWNLWRNFQEQLPLQPNPSPSNQETPSDAGTISLASIDEKVQIVLEDDENDPLLLEKVLNELFRNNESLSELGNILESIDAANNTIKVDTAPPAPANLEEKKYVTEQNRKIELYKQQVNNLEQQLEKLKSRQNAEASDLTCKDREKWQEDLRDRDNEIENLKHQLSAAAAANASVTKAVYDKEQQINILRRLDEGRSKWVTGFTRASESVHSTGEKQVDDEVVDATRQISQLRWEIEQYSNRTSQLGANLKLKEKEIDDLYVERDEIAASLSSAKNLISEQNVQIEEMKKLKSDLESKQNELENKNNEINSLMEDIMSLNEQNGDTQYDEKIKEMKILARAKDERITQLDASVSELKRKLAICERDRAEERAELTAQLEQQRSVLDEKEDMLNSAADRVFDLEDMVDTLQEDLRELEVHSKQQETNSHGQDGVCEECRDAIEELKNELVTTQQALEEAVELAESQKHRYQEIINEQDQDLETLRQALKARDDSNGDRSFSSIPRPKNRQPGVNPRASISVSSLKKSTDMPEASFNAKHADLQDLNQQMQILAEEKERLETSLREKGSLLSDKDKDLMQYAHMVESLRRDTVDLRNELEDTQDELNRLVAAETHTDRTSNSRTSDSKA